MLPAGSRRRSLIPLLVTASLTLAAALAPPVSAQGGPPGNNGTVKIDRLAFDDHPNNEPHVGCTFEVDFYGFDLGDLWADVTFEAHPPTGHGVLLTDRVFIGHDDNSGGGSEAGLDAAADYDLTAALAAFTPHQNQGFHVKLTVNADGSHGADTKHKVFWVGPCAAPPVTPPGGGGGGGGGGVTPPRGGVLGGSPPVGILPDTSLSGGFAPLTLLAGAGVLGASILALVAVGRTRPRPR